MTVLETNASVQITFEQGRLILRMTACISFEESRISSLKSACLKLVLLCRICLAVGKRAIERCRKRFQPETSVSDDLQDLLAPRNILNTAGLKSVGVTIVARFPGMHNFFTNPTGVLLFLQNENRLYDIELKVSAASSCNTSTE